MKSILLQAPSEYKQEKSVLEAASLIFCEMPSCDWHSLLLMSETDVPH